MSPRRPPRCRCCLGRSDGAYCERCSFERLREVTATRAVIEAVWGSDGLVRFDAAMRARRLQAARRKRGAAA